MLIDYNEIAINELAINLPGSKSISNRALIIQKLCKQTVTLNGLSDAQDTQTLKALLADNDFKNNVGMAGTAARFLSAYLATQSATTILSGEDRMHERPMKELLDALSSLGTNIEFLGKPGFLPVQINGANTKGGSLQLDASVSSQFVSALMMIAPVLKGGLRLKLTGKTSSKPYILMTKKIMEYFGINLAIEGTYLIIPEQNYQGGQLTIESDWSAASYFYSALCLLDEGSILLKNTAIDSWQGDSVVAEIYYRLGITTSRNGDDLLLEKSVHVISYLEYDFSDCPDLAQSVICTCVGLGVEGSFTGMQTLRNKETDRIQALQNELLKFNWVLKEEDENHFELKRSKQFYEGPMQIKTYNDHRMAMAFAPLAIIHGQLEILTPEVVQKSFPNFWEEMQKLGIH